MTFIDMLSGMTVNNFITLHRCDHRKADASVTRCRFDDGVTGLKNHLFAASIIPKAMRSLIEPPGFERSLYPNGFIF
jgi:hypothetical protein